jgi:hypothetical protein
MFADVDHDGPARCGRGHRFDVHVRVIDVVLEGGMDVRVVMVRIVGSVAVLVIVVGTWNTAPEDVQAGSDVL